LHAVGEVEAARRERVLRRECGAEERHPHGDADRDQAEHACGASPDEAHGASEARQPACEGIALRAEELRDGLAGDGHQVARTLGSRAMITRSAMRLSTITAADVIRKM